MEGDDYSRLKDAALAQGMALFGVARIDDLKDKATGLSPQTLDKFPLAISLAAKLSESIIEDIQDHPTQLYLHHYRQVNYLLDRTALLLTDVIQKQGYRALPIPASQVIDWEHQRGHLSHKLVAQEAGLGWIGKSNLLVTPKWGARVRLVSILTDLPLRGDTRLTMDCGSCQRCLERCPAGAIKEKKEDFDYLVCFEQLKRFRKEYNIGHYICGICVKACRPDS